MRTRTSVFRSENEFVRWLGARMAATAAGVRIGIGDDAAIVKATRGAELILKTDMSLEGVHFDSRLHPPRSVGHRALARPLSDIAAMGGAPRFALISLAVSRSASRRWIEDFFRGLRDLAKRYGVAIVGGDTAIKSGRTFVDVALIGEVKKNEALLRSGARPGDLVYVSGWLGLSRLGLEVLRGQAGLLPERTLWSRPRREAAAWERRPFGWERRELARAIKAHLYPEPRVALGRLLADKHLASAAIDVSDGLSTDLGHLIEASGVAARIWASLVPAPRIVTPGHSPEGHGAARTKPPDARGGESLSRRIAATTGARSLSVALNGGEDYELLFTVPARLANRIPKEYGGVPLHRIGEIKRGRGMTIVNPDGREAPLRPGGYDHFSKGRLR